MLLRIKCVCMDDVVAGVDDLRGSILIRRLEWPWQVADANIWNMKFPTTFASPFLTSIIGHAHTIHGASFSPSLACSILYYILFYFIETMKPIILVEYYSKRRRRRIPTHSSPRTILLGQWDSEKERCSFEFILIDECFCLHSWTNNQHYIYIYKDKIISQVSPPSYPLLSKIYNRAIQDFDLQGKWFTTVRRGIYLFFLYDFIPKYYELNKRQDFIL